MECFIITPFSSEFDDVSKVIKESVEGSIEGEVIKCYRLDDHYHAGHITEELLSAIRSATFCIADISQLNPNVMWEIGYAMALNKPIIFIYQKETAIPFDIRDMRSIPYDRFSMSKTLAKPLKKACSATIAHYDLPIISTPPLSSIPSLAKTFSITGSMNARGSIVKSRLETALSHYLGKNINWLCGSNGVVDETVIDFLGSAGENVETFGYHRLDISSAAQKLLSKYNIPFFDASAYPIPAGVQGPSERDKIFLTKASFHFLIWNGQSEGIKDLKKFYDDNMVNYQIIFTK